MLESIDAAGQVHYLLSHPFAVVQVALQTLKNNHHPYSHMFIGVLGWLDTPLPDPFYPLAWAVLWAAFAYGLSWGRSGAWRWTPVVAGGVFLFCFAAIHAALYLTWNVVGADYVQGVQGRYFLPLAFLVCLMIEGPFAAAPQHQRAVDIGYRALAALVLAFPIVSLLVVERIIVLRYYLD